MKISFAVLVLCMACSKASQTEPSPAPAPPPAAEQHVGEAKPSSDDTTPIDASKAKSFVAYQDKLIPLVREWVKTTGEMNANAKNGKYDGVVGTARGYQDLKTKTGPVAERFDKLREENGITESELTGLNEIAAIVVVSNDELKNRINAQVAEMEKAITAIPESEREEAQKSLTELKQMRANLLEFKELRQKYGDGIVDAMLKQETELKRQRTELTQVH